MTYALPIAATFGPRATGLSRVGYTVENAAGDVLIARTEVSVSERLNGTGGGTGIYEASRVVRVNWGLVRVFWDAADQASANAEETIDCSAFGAAVIGVKG